MRRKNASRSGFHLPFDITTLPVSEGHKTGITNSGFGRQNLHCALLRVWPNCDTDANYGRNGVKSLTLRSRQRSLIF
jgi:hypothetical protein